MNLEVTFKLTDTDKNVNIKGVKIGVNDVSDAMEFRDFLLGKARAFTISKEHNSLKDSSVIDPLIGKKINKEVDYNQALKMGLITKTQRKQIDSKNYCPEFEDFNEFYAIKKIKRTRYKIHFS